jgi:hypothetical protein
VPWFGEREQHGYHRRMLQSRDKLGEGPDGHRGWACELSQKGITSVVEIVHFTFAAPLTHPCRPSLGGAC